MGPDPRRQCGGGEHVNHVWASAPSFQFVRLNFNLFLGTRGNHDVEVSMPNQMTRGAENNHGLR